MSAFAFGQSQRDESAGSRRARARRLATGLVFAFTSVTAAKAQSARPAFEIRPLVGAYIATGDQRDVLKDAVLVGGQLSWYVIPALGITGTFGWSPSKDRITPGDQTLDIYQYDVGAELRAASLWSDEMWSFTPFVGAGVGGRTYNYRDLNVDSKTDFDGYGSLGGDIALGAIGFRLEARDYVSQFKPLTGAGATKTRNDVGLAAGFSYRF